MAVFFSVLCLLKFLIACIIYFLFLFIFHLCEKIVKIKAGKNKHVSIFVSIIPSF